MEEKKIFPKHFFPTFKTMEKAASPNNNPREEFTQSKST